MADGVFYHDSRPPFQTGAFAAVSPLTTSVALWPVLGNSELPTNYWVPGKRVWVRAFGTMTTAATPGNMTLELRLAQASALGVIIATSTAVALTASKTNISWWFEGVIECRTNGVTGTMFGYGKFIPNALGLLIPAANNPIIMPESGTMAAVTVDTTLAANAGISLQMKRSGSTAESVQVHDLAINSMN
jgi:hypothetical protein